MFSKARIVNWIGECGDVQMQSLAIHNPLAYEHVTRYESATSYWYALFQSTYYR